MATQSPFSLVAGLVEQIGAGLQPPPWLVSEVQHRLVLLLNHVLMQEPEAQARLARQKGQQMRMQWRNFALQLAATPAGLLELVDGNVEGQPQPALQLTITETSPFALAQAVLRGDKPAVRIEGDVQLAAEVNWLADHVRWDIEEDLARVLGDVPAQALGRSARSAAQALQQFVRSRAGAGKAAS
jgi:ubiquinone biosynthesis protein UbiJ